MAVKLLIDCSRHEDDPEKIQLVQTNKEEDSLLASDALLSRDAKTAQSLREQHTNDLLAKLQAGSASPAELQKAVAASLGAPLEEATLAQPKLIDKINAFLAT